MPISVNSLSGDRRRFRPHPQEETRARDRLADELHRFHDHMPREVVTQVVAEAWQQFAEASVRTFVPELTRRSATARLAARTRPLERTTPT